MDPELKNPAQLILDESWHSAAALGRLILISVHLYLKDPEW